MKTCKRILKNQKAYRQKHKNKYKCKYCLYKGKLVGFSRKSLFVKHCKTKKHNKHFIMKFSKLQL